MQASLSKSKIHMGLPMDRGNFHGKYFGTIFNRRGSIGLNPNGT
jgi:hypothetical protein